MIIKKTNDKGIPFRQWIPKLLLGLGLVAVLLCCYYFFFGQTSDASIDIRNSFEKTSGVGYKVGKYTFSGAGFQSKEAYRTGSHSLLLESDTVWRSAHVELDNPGNKYGRIAVWMKPKEGNAQASIHVRSLENDAFSRISTRITEEVDGWSLMEIHFVAPDVEKVQKLSIHLELEGKGKTYFDDLSIQMGNDYMNKSAAYQPEKLDLRIDDEGVRKLSQKRREALEIGILRKNDDDWVDAQLVDGEKIAKASVRLKGDWTDHLKGNKWSYRVKFKKDHTWKRMRVLSLQSPAVRYYLHEWVLHQLWEKEDILTTRYDFVHLNVNGKPVGVYAYEEHFEKQLLEFRYRREGPIVRFDEDAVWTARHRFHEEFRYVPDGMTFEQYQFKKAPVTPFKEGKTMKSPVLKKQFEEAKTLMFQYQQRKRSASDVFDLDQMAKYYVICDIMDAHHATVWHNQRFYYNPVTNKLEPIGYDGNVSEMKIQTEFRGQMYFNNPEEDEYMHVFTNLARDTTFVRKYMYYLDQMTRPGYLEAFFAEVEEGARVREALLKTEFEETAYTPSANLFRAKKIQGQIHPFNEHSCRVFTQATQSNTKTLNLRNVHTTPMVVIGTGSHPDNMSNELEEPILMWSDGFGHKVPDYYEVTVPIDAKYVFCKAIGLDDVVYSSIKSSSIPQVRTASQGVFSDIQWDTTGIYQKKGDIVLFQAGQHTVDRTIVIPEGLRVVFEQGVNLDFIKGAGFISRSPVSIMGTEENPVSIESSDQTARGFTVLQANDKSEVNHAEFKGFNTWKEGNWNLTGAVTFYESDVDISHLLITENPCEDGLNIIRSEFVVRDMVVSKTLSDGFDADFCKGEIHDSYFIATGNDGMDFSGSVIHIYNCHVRNGGDKGLSVGEESHVTVHSMDIDGSVLGVASKDLSQLHIKNISMKNCQQGFSAYRKKPEYGGASISVEQYQASDIERLHTIEKGSLLVLDGNRITE